MEGMFKGTGLTELDLHQGTQAELKKKMGNFDEADIQKAYDQAQLKDDETVTITSRSRQIESKLQEHTKTDYPLDLNISPAKDSSITSGINQEAAEYDDASLFGVSYLALDLEGYDISFLGDNASLTGEYIYPPGDDSLRVSTSTGHTSASKVKQYTLLLTQ